jgi:hypothetical protein
MKSLKLLNITFYELIYLLTTSYNSSALINDFFFFLKFKMNFTMFLYVNLEKLAGQDIRYQSKD